MNVVRPNVALQNLDLYAVGMTLEMIEGVMQRDRARAEAALDAALRASGWHGDACARFPDACPNEELVARAYGTTHRSA